MDGLDAEPAHGLDRGLDHLGMPVDHLAHVPVLLFLLDLDGSARLALADLAGEPPDVQDASIFVASWSRTMNSTHVSSAPDHLVRMDEPFALLRCLG